MVSDDYSSTTEYYIRHANCPQTLRRPPSEEVDSPAHEVKYSVIVKVGGRFHSRNYEKPQYLGGSPWFIRNVKPFQFSLQELLQAVQQMMGSIEYRPSLIWFYDPDKEWPACLTCIKKNEDINMMWRVLTNDGNRSVCSIYVQDVQTEGLVRDGKMRMTYELPGDIDVPDRRLNWSGYFEDALELQRLDNEIEEADKNLMDIDGEKWYITR